MAEITKDQRIAILVYKEDHPRAYPPEISEATEVPYRDVVHVLREHEAETPRFKININNVFEDEELTRTLAANLEEFCQDKVRFEVEDVTPCAFRVNHGPGHQSETYCEATGPHEYHRMDIMGQNVEFDQDGKEI